MPFLLLRQPSAVMVVGLLYFLSNVKYIPVIFFVLTIKFSSTLLVFYKFFGRSIAFVFVQK